MNTFVINIVSSLIDDLWGFFYFKNKKQFISNKIQTVNFDNFNYKHVLFKIYISIFARVFPPAEIVICFYFGNQRGKNRKICNVCKIVFKISYFAN